MKIVFIHGRAQQGKDAAALQRQWEAAFDEGLRAAGLSRPAGLEIAFPYYGNTLDELVAELDAPLVADVIERGATQDDTEADFRGEFLGEIATGAGFSDDDIRENYDGEYTERGPLNWRWVRAILKTLDRSQKIGELALDRFTRDVYVYLTYPAVARRIEAAITPHVTADRCVVVGHSLGSIIGYNVLRAHPHRVTRYVTLGSPLGVRAIKRRLTSPLTMPAGTESWWNALDPDDPVALRPLDADHFGITPAIANHTGVDNTTDNQHGIVGYLDDPWVAQAIHAGLT